jgi:CRP-like cAMP-binding protein
MLESLPPISLFDSLDTEQSALLRGLFESFTCAPDTFIIEQGKPALYLYIILKGRADIHYKPYDGPDLLLTSLKDGDVFGWSVAVGSTNYTSGVRSQTCLEAIRIRRESFWKLLARYPETGRIIVDRLALNVSPRWTNAHEQIEQLIQPERR